MQRAYFKTFMVILVCLTISISSTLSGSALASPVSPGSENTHPQVGPYAVSSGAVYVRGGPGTGFWIVNTLFLGEIVPILYISPDNAWWYVSTSLGEGWVAGISVTAYNIADVQVYDPGPIGTVTAGALHVRYGAGANSASLGRIGQGDQVYVLAQNANGSWLQIRWAYGVGWVTARYLATTAAVGAVNGEVEGETAEEVIPLTSESPYAIVMAKYLNVRSGPGINYVILGQVYSGQELPIIGRSSDSSWYQVTTTYGAGWVYAGYVVTRNEYGGTSVTTNTAAEAAVAGPIGIVNTGALNVRSGPGPQYTTLWILAGGAEAQIVGRNADWSWWLLNTPNGQGWAYAYFILVRGDTASVPYVAPGTTVAPDMGVLGGTAPDAVVAGPVAIVITGALNIRTGPNSVFPSLGVVYGGTRMPIIGQSLDRGWWYVDSEFGNGYVSKLHILTDGSTNDVPVVQ